jgi:hypothetical protein
MIGVGRLESVDLHDAGHVGHEALVEVEGPTESVPVVGQDEREVIDVERLVLVREADPA